MVWIPYQALPSHPSLQWVPMEHEKWETLKSEIILERLPWLRVLSEDVRLPDGAVVEGYLRLESPDFVMIVALNHRQEIGLIRSYKHGPKEIDLQPPAGYIEQHENPLNAAKRELLEEAGCSSQEWQCLGVYTISGNQGVGKAHFYLAQNCISVTDPNPGDLEIQEVAWIPIQEVETKWASGQLRQLSSIAILGLAFQFLRSIP